MSPTISPTMRLTRTKFFSVLNLHFLGLGLLVLLNLILGVRLFAAWHTLRTSGAEQIEQAQTRYRTIELEMRPLRGLPGKVTETRKQGEQFYDERFPTAYSAISGAIGDLANKNNVHLTRVAYVQSPALSGLAEVRMDASLSGEYAPLMHFINGLERSKSFFLIDGLTLTGEQGGLVNLRLTLTTYLHAADLDRLTPPPAAGEPNTGGDNR
jgi:type IV pilus assembly protein PilO